MEAAGQGVACRGTTKGPMWGYPVPVLRAISPFLEPFRGRLSPNIDNVSEKLTLRYPGPSEGPWVLFCLTIMLSPVAEPRKSMKKQSRSEYGDQVHDVLYEHRKHASREAGQCTLGWRPHTAGVLTKISNQGPPLKTPMLWGECRGVTAQPACQSPRGTAG